MAKQKTLEMDDNTKWMLFDQFNGFNTIDDPEKVIDGECVDGYNTSANNGDRISLRNKGYEKFGDLSEFSTTDSITSMHTFRRRDGINIIMASFGTYMAYYNPSSLTWEALKTDYSSGKIFGYADYTLHTDTSSQVYFGNAVDYFARWTGNFTKLTTAVAIGEATVYVSDTTGFPASGTIVISGVNHAYTSKTANTFVLTGTATVNLANGRGISEAIDIRTGSTFIKGNIYLMANNRLFISGVVGSPQAVYFSKYGDPLDFSSTSLVTGSTATASGTFNLAEGGGGVSGLIFDEGSIYAFKRSMIYKITLTDALYTLQQIKPFDGKSQTIGGVSSKCIFTGSNYVFFITPDKQIMSLERIEQVDYPQNVPISIKISPNITNGKNDISSGITFNDIAYFSCKSSDSLGYNDIIYPWNISDKFWDAPITGWNASDFTIYDNGTSEDLYFGSSNDTNVYKVIDKNSDDVYNVVGLWRSKQYTFGMPHIQKIITDIFIEGYISESTNLNIKLYLDEDGYTQQFSTILSGTENGFQFSQDTYNVFGANPLGVEVLGGNDEFTGLVKFRVYLNKNFRLKPFYNCQIEFNSDGQNQNWEIIQYGFKVAPYTQQQSRKLFKTFNE